jgi:hypothetical protein
MTGLFAKAGPEKLKELAAARAALVNELGFALNHRKKYDIPCGSNMELRWTQR